MSETYCGKNCETCAQREALGCAGCGCASPRAGECAIADCCREKGHATCVTCTAQDRCLKLDARDGMPQRRLEKQRADAARREHLVKIAPVFAKWLWVLFWCMIVSETCALLTNDDLLRGWPWGVKAFGELVSVVCSILSFAVLFKLAPYERQYRVAAWCSLGAIPIFVAALVLNTFVGEFNELLAVLLVVGAFILKMYANYKIYHAHAAILVGLDDELSEKWVRLWKWTAYALLAVGIGLVVGLIGGLLGLLVMVAGAVGLLVIVVLDFVYTYRTAQAFRELANNSPI